VLIQSYQFSRTWVIITDHSRLHFSTIYQLPCCIYFSPVLHMPLKHDHHQLIIDFIQFNRLDLTGHGVNKGGLVQFEEFYMFDEECYHVVLVLDTIERSDLQELVEFLARSR